MMFVVDISFMKSLMLGYMKSIPEIVQERGMDGLREFEASIPLSSTLSGILFMYPTNPLHEIESTKRRKPTMHEHYCK